MTAIDKIERPAATGPFEEGTTGSPLEEAVVAALREVFDPEIPVNIFDLGLIYVVDIAENGDVYIGMTLTAPGCPVAGEIPIWVRDAVLPVEGVKNVEVEILWDPPWNPDNMSDAARLDLGMF
ncbi:SUF system Fe-S cluster assembly protein [Sneathiella sp. HT1-7]|jgi:FeS assembly SUF system protein|uniref:SUF system Fe-S cluster assembly protein n=1 Tax=Sneathiella sp. HT1-7 TaxID=2887192 RepID=UPI001D15A1ED|nr:SUF system Fe-S cluster assembly protein [Sneathiella sp. HT1-7]MCC3305902.1 SUF system Fe-S cluster assembly protein [Sneathiella sp. HT1-7]